MKHLTIVLAILVSFVAAQVLFSQDTSAVKTKHKKADKITKVKEKNKNACSKDKACCDKCKGKKCDGKCCEKCAEKCKKDNMKACAKDSTMKCEKHMEKTTDKKTDIEKK